MDDTTFSKILAEQARGFGESLGDVLAQLSQVPVTGVTAEPPSKSLAIRADYVASISFVGMASGEFVLAVDSSEAMGLFPNEREPADIRAVLSEALNMAAGARLQGLAGVFKKVTITPPKIFSGEVFYPSVRNVAVKVQMKTGVVRAFFFIDRMRLDIAESYQAVIRDLTKANEDLTVAGQKLQAQQAQLVHSEKMASLGMMAAGVAHEINNPLSFVVSNTDVLGSYIEAMKTLLNCYDELLQLLGSGKSAEARVELERIAELKRKEDIGFVLQDTRKLLEDSRFGLDRIRVIVNGLKRFSRVDDGEIKSVSLNEELQNTLMLLQNELKYKCAVETSFESQRTVECFPGELSQVFVNLIVNASQAIEGQEGKITISTQDGPLCVKVRVIDNGSGISPENLTKLFSPFFTTKPVGVGTGLGLAIAHGIIKKHQGTISVESKVGVGTTFTVELPYLQQSEK